MSNPLMDLVIVDGAAHVWFAYDLGHQIDLDRAQQRIASGSERERIRHEHRAPAYLQFQPAPLKVDEPGQSFTIASLRTDARVESTLYDFGAISIAYRIPLDGVKVSGLLGLAGALSENQLLLEDSHRRVSALLAKLGDAVKRAQLSELVEDYAVFHVRRWSPAQDPAKVVDDERALVAGILRCEPEPMRASEVDDALQSRIAYGLQDDLVVDWNGALLFDALGEDTLSVLEFANVELLEMRFLDDRLDEALERSHEVVRKRRGLRSMFGLHSRDSRESLRRIARLEIDNAILFESVNNAIKLVGDQFLARVYRLAAKRFHLDDWDASILRKLETVQSIYSKLSDELTTRRMELLEWIIILLFVVSIVLPFVVSVPH